MNRASAGLETIIAKVLHRAPAGESALLDWPVACGSAVAERTRALSFSDGILRVEVADGGWRRELANLAPRYLAHTFPAAGFFRGLRRRLMKITDKDVAYVADLANLELTEEERAHMLRDLNSILEYIERLSELETGEVAPMAQVSDRYGVDESRQGSDRFAYAIREDVKDGLRESLPHDVAVNNAPDTDGIFFEVPKVIER